jgi:hypothetical protein
MLTNHILGHFTHNKKAVPPWKNLSEDLNHKFIVPESLLKGMMLADPSRFTEGRVQAFWDHWLNWQSADLQGLVFRKAKPGAMRDASPLRRHRCQKKVDDGTVDFFDDPEKVPDPATLPTPTVLLLTPSQWRLKYHFWRNSPTSRCTGYLCTM